jgi:hypothetical protein
MELCYHKKLKYGTYITVLLKNMEYKLHINFSNFTRLCDSTFFILEIELAEAGFDFETDLNAVKVLCKRKTSCLGG